MKSLYKLILFSFVLALPMICMAQTNTTDASTSGDKFVFDVNAALLLMAIILLIVILFIGSSMRVAVKYLVDYKYKNGKNNLLPWLIIGCTMFASDAFGQNSSNAGSTYDVYRILLFIIIALELLVIFFMIRSINVLTGIDKMKMEEDQLNPQVVESKKLTFWERFNNLKSQDQEKDLLLDHNYDGIQELDNTSPPWFTWSFIATIVFACIYMYRYHIAYSAPSQIQEYEASVEKANVQMAALLKSAPSTAIDENNIPAMEASELKVAATLYASNCLACHGDKGQGGVGPNMTDKYYIHGASLNDIFKTIKYGVPAKGMKAWQDDFSSTQIAQLANYVKSLEGSNVPGGKKPEGTLDTGSENKPSTTESANTTKDTTKVETPK